MNVTETAPWLSSNNWNVSTGSEQNSTISGSRYLCLTTTEISVAVNIITILVGLVIIIGNTLVLVVLIRYPSRKFTPLNWLLFHLGLADLAIGLTVFFWYGIAEVLLLPISNSVKVIFYGISIVAVMASLQGLMMIAFDRYLLILHSVRYNAIFTKSRMIVSLIIMWLLPSIIEIFIPISGWNCVEHCDCRIHNVRPDDEYCFHESCSHMLPPLNRTQLLMGSVLSCVFFVVTLTLYAVIFRGVHLQALKVKNSTNNSRKPSNVPSSPISANNSSISAIDDEDFKEPAQSPSAFQRGPAAWRGHVTEAAQQTTNVTEKQRDVADRDCRKTVNYSEKVLIVQPSVADGIAVSSSDTQTAPDDKAAASDVIPVSIVYKRNNEMRDVLPSVESPRNVTAGKSGQVPDTDPSHLTKVPGKRSLSLTIPKSLTRLAVTRGRPKRSRKRDVRVMRSMFIIMAVFVLTTTPLMIFILYTHVYNERGLKEIFNILLQLTTINSLLNPFLYFSRIPAMRRKLKRLINDQYWRKIWNQCKGNGITTPAVTVQPDSSESGQSE